jgi:1-deoxyxylulose-5-phosphate synthase
MKMKKLGRTGLDISPLCLGCMTYGVPNAGKHAWTLDADRSRPLVRAAVDAGINFFDTANTYSAGTSEEMIGAMLGEFTRRDEIVVATKVFYPVHDNGPNQGGLSRKAILQAIDDSLSRLKMDYVDLYQIHRWDYGTPIEETMEALHDVVKSGKARYIGASSMYAWQFGKAQNVAERHGWTRFSTMQNHLNLLYREEEREMLPLCLDQGVGVIPWSPLARGTLARAPEQHTDRAAVDPAIPELYGATAVADRKVIEAVGEVAQQRGVPRAQVALAWLMQKEPVSAPIIGVTKPHHLVDAVAALELILEKSEVEDLEREYVPHAVAGIL